MIYETDKKCILIYGAHLVAIECCRDMRFNGYGEKLIGFAVSDMKENPDKIEGLPVRCIADYSDQSADCLVIIAMPKIYHDEVEANAGRYGFTAFERISLEDMSVIKGERLLKEKDFPLGLFASPNDPSWLDARADVPVPGARFKFPTLFYLEDTELIREATRYREEYSSELEGFAELSKLTESRTGSGNVRDIGKLLSVYMVFHAGAAGYVQDRSSDPWIRPLQVGCSNTGRIDGVFHDDEREDSLSEKNPVFAEMTGADWISGCAPESEYKGLCHYRRLFDITCDDIAAMKENDIDVLLTTPRFAPGGIREMFGAETPVKKPVFEAMLRAVDELFPDDADGFSEYLQRRFYFPNNMVIAKSSIYDDSCRWVMPVLVRMLGIDKETGYGHENDRHIAYAAELLTSYFFAGRGSGYKIAYTDYRFIG